MTSVLFSWFCYCWFVIVIIIFLPSFSIPFHIHISTLPQIHGLFFVTKNYCMTVCVTEYNLASLYSVTCMDTLRVDSLPPDN